MTNKTYRETMAAPYRVLDLTDEKGLLCGKILGDLGADVIKVENPSGDSSRRIGPFYKDMIDPEKSLYWFAYNTNKRSITLDIEKADGRDLFKRLVRQADLIIESFPPGRMDALGLGYRTLKKINNRIILVSITPFGQKGPYKDFQVDDLTITAMGGMMYLTGDPDRPPLRIGFPQAFFHAAADAAVGAMIALYYRQSTGTGQWIDVGIQQSLLILTASGIPNWDAGKVVLRRAGPYRTGLSSGAVQRQIWECKDGYITYTVMGGGWGAKTNRALVKWMDREGYADEYIKSIDWDAFDMTKADQAVQDRLEKVISRFFKNHTKEELFNGAVKRRMMLYPVSSPKDIVDNHHLKERDFWVEVNHEELHHAIQYPGAFIRSNEVDCGPKTAPPLIGEHNRDIYENELGLSKADLVMLKARQII